MTPEQRRTAVTLAAQTAGISERRACRFTGFARSSQRYRLQRVPDTALLERLKTLAIKKPRWGYRQLTRVLRREPGARINYKRVQRLYQAEGLQVRRRRRKHRAKVPRTPMPVPTQPNERWSMDFVRDTLGDGRAFRALTIVDDCTRESPAIEVDFSLPGARVVAVLDRLARTRGLPQRSYVTTDRSSPAQRSMSGRSSGALCSTSSIPGSRRRTRSSRASMARSARSA